MPTVGLALLLCAFSVSMALAQPTPVYSVTLTDCVWPHDASNNPTRYLDQTLDMLPNGEACDIYALDRYERPTSQSASLGSLLYYPDVDIEMAEYGMSGNWFFFRLHLVDTRNSLLNEQYGFVLDLDQNSRGDFYVFVKNPVAPEHQSWTDKGVSIYYDSDAQTVGDPGVGATNAQASDCASGSCSYTTEGYDCKFYTEGELVSPPARVRIDGSDPTRLEFAVQKNYLLTHDDSDCSGTNRFSATDPFDPLVLGWANRGNQNENQMNLHDHYDASSAGDPYPTATHFPPGNIYELDFIGTVLFKTADLACVSSPNLPNDNASPGAGDIVTFTPSFTNQGPNEATGITVTVTYDAAKFECPSGDCMPTGGDTQNDATPGTIVFTINTLASSATEAFSFKLKVKDAATGDGRVDMTVTDDNIFDPDSSPGALTLPVPQDDECTVSFANLPVELIAFEAVLDGRAALLTWATASETNNAGFEVQHRFGQDAFETMTFVEGHGTTLEAQHYSYRAEDLTPGRHVFRLKQIDFDGAFEYSPELEVTVEMPEMYFLTEVYPNPFNPEARLDFAVRQSQAVTAQVYNLLGQRVLELYRGIPSAGVTQSLVIDGSGLQSGMYVVRIQGERFVDTRTFTLIR